MSMAQLTLIGNTGKEPEMNYTPNGVPVTKFSVAVSHKVGDKEETIWYNCTAFRGLAETISSHVHKGQQVFIQGKFLPRSYTTKDGRPGVSYDVTVDNFQFIGNKPAGTGVLCRNCLNAVVEQINTALVATSQDTNSTEQLPNTEPEKPFTCADCGKHLAFSEMLYYGNLTYCFEHVPDYDKHQQW